MVSICCNCCVKLQRQQKRPAKNNKNKIVTDKYNWEAINYPSEKDGWGKIEKINPTIVLYTKKEKIYPAYVSEHNSLWKISFSFNDSKREGWHYIAVKNYPHYYDMTYAL